MAPPPDFFSGNPDFAADWAALGFRRCVDLNVILPGPFLLGGSLTDNALTAVDLTLIAAWLDAKVRDLYTANDPKFTVHIEAIEFLIEDTGLADTEALIADLFERTFIYAKLAGEQGKELRFNVASFAGTTFDQTQTTANNATRQNRHGRIFVPPSPFEVNLETDTFEVEPFVAVDTSANIPFQLILHGGLWPNNIGRPPTRRCIDLDGGKGLRQEHLRMANSMQYTARDRSGA